MQGTTVNGYSIVSLIGRGGMAEVWKSENGLGVCFAIKAVFFSLRVGEKNAEKVAVW